MRLNGEARRSGDERASSPMSAAMLRRVEQQDSTCKQGRALKSEICCHGWELAATSEPLGLARARSQQMQLRDLHGQVRCR